MLKSEKIESGAAWSLRGLWARTVGDYDKSKGLGWTLYLLGLFTVVPVYYFGGFIFVDHGYARQRKAKLQQHRELVDATKNRNAF